MLAPVSSHSDMTDTTFPSMTPRTPNTTFSMDWSETVSYEAERPDPNCRRPLAPPACRQTVQHRFKQLGGWKRVDPEGDLLIATGPRKRKRSSSVASSVTEPAVSRLSDQTRSPTQISQVINIKPKKPRLHLSQNAQSIANEPTWDRVKSEEGDAEQSLAWKPAKSTAFEEVSDDEGYHTSSTGSPKSITGMQLDEENDLNERLATYHQLVPTRYVTIGPSAELVNEVVKDSEQRLVEERAARQSRLLRERAKNGSTESRDTSGLFSGTESGSEADEQPNQTPKSSFVDLFKSVTNAPPHGFRAREERYSLKLTRPTTTAVVSRSPMPPSQLRRTSLQSRMHTPIRRGPSIPRDPDAFNPVSNLRQQLTTSKPQPSKRVRFGGIHNPLSRAAAEGWRTQDRHREFTTETLRTAPSVDREARLRDIQGGINTIVSEPDTPEIWPDEFFGEKSQDDSNRDPPQRPLRADIVPLEPLPGSHNGLQQPVSPAEVPLREPGRVPGNSRRTSPFPDYQDSTRAQPTTFVPGETAQQEGGDQHSRIPLGELAIIDINDDEAVKAERRRLRELASDLRVLEETYREMARIYALRAFTEPERVMKYEAEQVVVRVVDQHKPGKEMRKIMMRVRDSFKSKAQARLDYVELSQEEVEPYYERLLGKGRALKVKDGQKKIAKSTLELEEAFRVNKRKIKEQKKHDRDEELEQSKQIRRAERAAQAEARPAKVKRPKLTQVQRRLADVRRLLGEHELHDNTVQNQQNEVQSGHPESDSEVSEEDADGTDFVLGGYTSEARTGFMAQPAYDGDHTDGLLVVENDMDEINDLEDERQQQQATRARGNAQALDEKLYLENMLKQAARKQAADNEVHFDDVAAESELDEALNEDADTDVDDDEVDEAYDTDSTDADEDDDQIYRHDVRAVFRGVTELYRDGEEYRLGRFYYQDQAVERLKKVMVQLHGRFATEFDTVKLSTILSASGAILEQKLKANDKDFFIRMWLDSKLVSRSKAEAQLAKKLPIINVREQWYVNWAKTTTTTTITPAGASICEADDKDDLFGSSTPEPDKVEVKTIVEQPSVDEITFWTNSRQANNSAKDVYMRWFAEFAPAYERPSLMYPGYYGHLRLIDHQLRNEIECALDGVGVGPWEEELERKLDDTGKDGVKVTVKEKFMVVVKRKEVRGAPN